VNPLLQIQHQLLQSLFLCLIFQEILQEARGECVIKVGSKKNSYTGKITDEWRICALHQEGKGKTFATAVLSLYGAITYAKVKEGGVL